jgi:hypothetical protein
MRRLFAGLSRSLSLYCAPLLLALVAGVQIYRAFAYGQSSWKGGGFGMFASLDAPDSCVVRIYLSTGGGEKRVLAPEALRKAGRLLRTVPTQANLARFTGHLARQKWVAVRRQGRDGTRWVRYRALRRGEARPANAEPVPVAALKVELWKRTFDAPTGRTQMTQVLRCEHRLRPALAKAVAAGRRER